MSGLAKMPADSAVPGIMPRMVGMSELPVLPGMEPEMVVQPAVTDPSVLRTAVRDLNRSGMFCDRGTDEERVAGKRGGDKLVLSMVQVKV